MRLPPLYFNSEVFAVAGMLHLAINHDGTGNFCTSLEGRHLDLQMDVPLELLEVTFQVFSNVPSIHLPNILCAIIATASRLPLFRA
jgi:hypothetical protein